MLITNKNNLPESIYNALKSDDYDYQSDRVSVTTLIDSPYIAKLRKEHWKEIEEDVSDRIWQLVGSAIHYMLEKADTENTLIEQRYTAEINNKKVTGKVDYYNNDTKEIQDFKVTSVWTLIYKDRVIEWEKQLNCYAYLMQSMGYKINSLKIIAILRDWVQSKSKEDSYPDKQIQIIDIPLWSIEEQEKYIVERLKLFDTDYTCSPHDRWAMPDTWAIKKKTRKTAMKVCNTEKEAKEYLASVGGDYIEFRQGKDRRCEMYCNVNKFCKYYKERLNENK